MPLIFVPTPLGNLRDVTLRALDVLRDAELIVAEDTRVARKLLARVGARGREIWSYREQNARPRDAGDPRTRAHRTRRRHHRRRDAGDSDPGSALIAAARDAGVTGRSAARPERRTRRRAASRVFAAALRLRGLSAARRRGAPRARLRPPCARCHDDLVRVAAAHSRRARRLAAVAPDAQVFVSARVHQAPRAAALGTPRKVVGAACRAGARRGRVRDRALSLRPRSATRTKMQAPRSTRCSQRPACRRGREGARGTRLRRPPRTLRCAPRRGRPRRKTPLKQQLKPMERAYYVTTPIYYISGKPHIGHAYTTIVADVLARTARTFRPTFFLTGTDEHGQKVANAAAAAGKTPQEWCDELVPRWKALFAAYHVEYDDFIRTTEPRHVEKVQRVFERLRAQRRRLPRQVRGLVLRQRRDVLARIEARRRPLPDVRPRGAVALRRRLVLPAVRIPRPAARAFRARTRSGLRPRSVYNEMMAMLERGPRRSLDLAHELRLGHSDRRRRRDLRLARRAAQLHHRDRLERGRRALSTLTGRRRRSWSAKRSRAFTRSSGRRCCGRSARAAPEARLRARLDHGRRPEDEQEPRQRGRSVRAGGALRRRRDALFSAARGAVRQRLLVLGREDRAAPQQRSRQRSRQSAAALALDAATLPRRHRSRTAGGCDAELDARVRAVAGRPCASASSSCASAKRSRRSGSWSPRSTARSTSASRGCSTKRGAPTSSTRCSTTCAKGCAGSRSCSIRSCRSA